MARERFRGAAACSATVCTCVQSLDKDCALCGFGLEIFVPCSFTEGLTLSTEEVCDLRRSLHHDCHTPDEDSDDDDDGSSAGTKRAWYLTSDTRTRPEGFVENINISCKKAKNVTPVYRPQANECREPRTRISLEFSALEVDSEGQDNRTLSVSKPPAEGMIGAAQPTDTSA